MSVGCAPAWPTSTPLPQSCATAPSDSAQGQLIQTGRRLGETHDALRDRITEVEKTLVKINTTLAFHNAIAAATLGFLAWAALTLFTMNGTLAKLDTSVGTLTESANGLQADMRDLRKSLDAHLIALSTEARQAPQASSDGR
jgi:hypothetical protein